MKDATYSQRILDLRLLGSPHHFSLAEWAGYVRGHKSALDQAAEIAKEADARIAILERALRMVKERWSDLAEIIRENGSYDNAGFCDATAKRCQDALDCLTEEQMRERKMKELIWP